MGGVLLVGLVVAGGVSILAYMSGQWSVLATGTVAAAREFCYLLKFRYILSHLMNILFFLFPSGSPLL